jgi:MFS family permease
MPDLMANFFAGQISRTRVHCQEYAVRELPLACVEGSAASVTWSSVTSFFSNAILAFFLYPMTGVWSDMIGRTPFLILAQFLAVLPKIVVLLHVMFDVSLYLFYPFKMLDGMIPLMVVTLAYISDCLPGEHKAAGFSMSLGALSAGIAIAPLIGHALGLQGAILTGIGLKLVGIVYTWVRNCDLLWTHHLATGHQKVSASVV